MHMRMCQKCDMPPKVRQKTFGDTSHKLAPQKIMNRF